MEIESGVTGRRHCQLRHECGNFLVDDGSEDMARCRGIRDPKRHAHCHMGGTGARECSKGSRGHIYG